MEAESDGEDGGIAGQAEDDGSDLEGGDDTDPVVVARPSPPPPPVVPRRIRRAARRARRWSGDRGGGRGGGGGGGARGEPAATAEAAAAASADAIVGAALRWRCGCATTSAARPHLRLTGLTLLRHLSLTTSRTSTPGLRPRVRGGSLVSGDLSDVCAAARVEGRRRRRRRRRSSSATRGGPRAAPRRDRPRQLGVCHVGADDVAAEVPWRACGGRSSRVSGSRSRRGRR